MNKMFRDMTDAELAVAYRAERAIAYDWSTLSSSVRPRTPDGRKVAKSWGRAMRNIDIIEAIARKRGISIRALLEAA